jgi:glutamate racemase
MPKKGPIGFFDSGYGGLTVLNEVRRLLPEYDYLYLGDNARAPYGTRSFEVVYEYTWQSIKYLFDQGCELVILACNTASAKALRSIQQKELLDYPGKRVLGVIRPSAENVGRLSITGEIVVLATEGTVNSNSYLLEFEKFNPTIKVHQYACPMWVPLVESGEYRTEEGKSIIKRDIQNVHSSFPKADLYLLGCTHYPILLDDIENFKPKEVLVISQGAIVAESLKRYFTRHSWLVKRLSTKGDLTYSTTEDHKVFEESVKNIFDLTLSAKQIKIK